MLTMALRHCPNGIIAVLTMIPLGERNMKRRILYRLLVIAALITFGQGAAQASVNKVGGTWVLSPVAWHPHKMHENYPFDMAEKSTGDTDASAQFSTDHVHPRAGANATEY